MDSFSSSYSLGASAPAPSGLTPNYVMRMLRQVLKINKVVAIDFVETNPTYDVNGSAARLAARLICEVMHCFNK